MNNNPNFPPPVNPQTPYNSGPPKMKPSIIALIAVASVLLIVIISLLISSALSSSQSVSKTWGRGAGEASPSEYVGVWQLAGTKAQPTDPDFTAPFDTSAASLYLAVDENNVVHNITRGADGTIFDHQTFQGEIKDGFLICGAPGLKEGSVNKYGIIDGFLTIPNYTGDNQQNGFLIYKKDNMTLDTLLGKNIQPAVPKLPPKAIIVQAGQAVRVVQAVLVAVQIGMPTIAQAFLHHNKILNYSLTSLANGK